MYASEKERAPQPKENTPTPVNSPSRSETKEEETLRKLEIRFIASQDDKIPDSLSPNDLLSAIDRGRVKYLFRGVKIPDDQILHMIKEGKIMTLRNSIRRIDRTIYKTFKTETKAKNKRGYIVNNNHD